MADKESQKYIHERFEITFQGSSEDLDKVHRFITTHLLDKEDKVFVTPYKEGVDHCPFCNSTEFLCGYPKHCSSDYAFECDSCGDQTSVDDKHQFQDEDLCEGCYETAKDEFNEEGV